MRYGCLTFQYELANAVEMRMSNAAQSKFGQMHNFCCIPGLTRAKLTTSGGVAESAFASASLVA